MQIAEAVLSKAQALNPLVKISTFCETVNSKDESFYKEFTIIIATGLDKEQLLFVSKICRNNNVQLICGDVFGMFGYSLSDLQNHEYYEYEYVNMI